MKKYLSVTLMVATLAIFGGCTKDLTERVDDLESRVDKIEVDLQKAIQAIEEATQKGYYISSYEELSDGSGYTFTFTNGKAVTILNGKDGAKGDDGDKGDKGDDGDKGEPGTPGKDGDAFFSSIEISETVVTFTLSDGRTFVIPLESAFCLNIATDAQKVSNGRIVELPYTVTNATEKTVVDYMVSGSYKAEIVATSTSEGTILVTTPTTASEGRLLVFADNGAGKTSIKVINFQNDDAYVETANVAVSANGGSFEQAYSYNVACTAVSSASWLRVMETKAVTTTFVLQADENTGLEARTATVTIKAGDVTLQSIKVAQEATHGIRSYAELVEFQKVSNSDNPDYTKFMTRDSVVRVLCDIDCTGSGAENDWTPICDRDIAGTASNIGCMAGWSYVFDGQNHTIKNLKINDKQNNATFGFFGAIYGGTVKNLVFDESCAIDIQETGKSRGTLYGAVASLINGGTIENVVYKGSVNLKHTTSAGFMVYGGIVGAATCYPCDTYIKSCRFEGTMTGESRTGNTTTTSPRMAGIVGHSMRVKTGQPYAPLGDYHIYISDCTVSGTLSLKGLRDGGIVGHAAGGNIVSGCKFTGTLINNCENNNTGTTIYSVARVGGIAGYVEASDSNCPDSFSGCEVEGTVVDLMQGAVGGLVGFTKKASFSNCSVNAKVASKYYGDKNPKDESKSIAYTAGVVAGKIQTKAATFTGIKGKGEFAKDYDTALVNPVVLTAGNASDYLIGNYAEGTDISGITFWAN